IDGSSWIGGAHYEPGDSGGPLFILSSKLGTPEGSREFARHGILVGVISGPAVFESWSWAYPCPCDYYGTATYPLQNWIESIVGSGVVQFVVESVEVRTMASNGD